MAQAGYTPIQLYFSTTAAAVPLAANLAQGELAINIADGKLYYENSSGVVTLLASASGASGDVVGPASATDNAVARFDGTTGKLIQNGVVIIGDTGAVTGVTDITASGSVTLSGGTANGVTYLNGSNVLTSGSALTFDGTRLGIGTSSPADILSVSQSANTVANISLVNANTGTAAQTRIRVNNSGDNFGAFTHTGSSFTTSGIYRQDGTYIFTNGAGGLTLNTGAAQPIYFATDSTERMRIDSSGNVGIGTSSPSYKLQVGDGSADTRGLFVSNNNFSIGVGRTTGTIGGYLGSPSSNVMVFSGNDGTEKIRIDSSGNVGIGVTPSAWGSGFKALNISGYGSSLVALTSAPYTWVGSNWYTDGSTDRYVVSNSAALYRVALGSHAWFTAPSGTAGNAITFTQAMTLDASGNLGIGTSSPTQRLTVSTSASDVASFISSDTNCDVYLKASGTTLGNTRLRAAGGDLVFITGLNDRMRIDSSGNVGIGVTPSAWSSVVLGLQVRNASIGGTSTQAFFGHGYYYDGGWKYIGTGARVGQYYIDNDGQHVWYTAPSGTAGNAITFTQALTLDASGNLLVGQTSSSATTNGFNVNFGQGATIPAVSVAGASSTNSEVNFTMYSTTASAYRFYVGYGGTINATSTTITGISDQRLKENIRDLDDGLASVMALQPRKFDWKEGKGADTKNARGFIAQEFETVFPDMIEKWLDPAPEGEEPYKAVNANLIPTLVKAIQEQQALIQTLKSRLDAANL